MFTALEEKQILKLNDRLSREITLGLTDSRHPSYNTFKKFCDKNYNESATNFVGSTKVEVITGDEYYQTYEDVFGDIAYRDNSLFNDYGQLWNGRQFFKYDFDPSLTESYSYKNLNKKAS